jgi:hypothetical protein
MLKKSRKNRLGLAPVYGIIFELSKLYGSECEVCLKKMKKAKSGFTIHHLEYKDGEKTHKDFKERIHYYKYLKPIVKKHHKRFAFLCNACHNSIDGIRGLNRRKRANVLRLFLMWFRTNT